MPATSKATDKNRFLKFKNPLSDKLILTYFSGYEKLSSLFEYHLELLSEDGEIDFDKIMGESVTVSLETASKPREFHGYITEFHYIGLKGRYFRYQATMKPWLWFLSRTADCRIFQNMKVVDIIKQVFSDNGMSDFEVSLSGTYRIWEYCVQYRETDLNFVSRLMEQEGIYYYFKHSSDKHVLVLSDSQSSHSIFPEHGTIEYFPEEGESGRRLDHINGWSVGREIVPEKVVLTDYNFKTPKAAQEGNNKATFKHARVGGDREVFDYPGEYTEAKEGDTYARNRMEELYTNHQRARGKGNSRGIAAGYLFMLKGFERKDQNKNYLVLSVSHDIHCDDVLTTAGVEEDISYYCKFEVMDAETPYRSPRITPKPIVQGPQTAVVVGPKGDEIYCDEFGRIKVQFHWDRKGKNDQESSCWMRISSAWAGKNWGSIHIPRIGHEVVVSFLEGDPDRPLVTGSVYNADNKPPYELGAHKTQSGFKSRSTKKGNANNFNEIRFEDEKDKEELRFQAEKDMNVGVKHIRKTFIGAELGDDGEGSKSKTCPAVGEMNEQLTVFADREIFIDGNDTLEIARKSEASKGRCMTIKNGNHELTVDKGDQTIDILTGNQTITLDKGDITRKVKLGKVLEEASKSIELKVGGSSIKIEPAKITIKSPQIAITGDIKVDVSSKMTSVDGSGMLKLSGGMVKIN